MKVTQSMMKIEISDIILVEFVFSEGIGTKKRPAVVISSNDYNKNRQEIIIAGVTSNMDRKFIGETRLKNWQKAGLKLPSMVTAIVQTIKKQLICKKLGTLHQDDWEMVQENLKKVLLKK